MKMGMKNMQIIGAKKDNITLVNPYGHLIIGVGLFFVHFLFGWTPRYFEFLISVQMEKLI